MNRSLIISRQIASRILLLFILLALILLGSLQSSAAPSNDDGVPFETMTLPPKHAWTLDVHDIRQTSQNPKLDSALADLAAAAKDSPQTVLALADILSLRLSGDRVHVQIVTETSGLQSALRAVEQVGGEVTKAADNGTLIQGWLPITALETVSANAGVYLIRRPAEPILLDEGLTADATTEGLAVINGPAWHAKGHTGAGVKIGVIDGGFSGYSSLLGSDLPATVTVKNFVDGETDGQVDGSTEHGTACAEVIHDIAPDATLFLAKIGTNLDLQQAIAWLKDTHQVDLISTSLGWYNLTPGDSTGEFADLVQDARHAGILWLTAAGNDRQAHWGGLYYDPDNTGYHYYNATQNANYFGPGDGTVYAIPPGYPIRVFMRWDDWTNVDQDYDLYLLRWNGSSWDVVAQGINVQDGGAGQTPTEFVAYVTSGDPTAYGFGIKRYDSNRDVNLEVFAPKVARLDELLHSRSLSNLGDAPGAMTVAALDVNAPYPQESYSSQGPTNGPGGAEAGGFVKPDIAAYANVSTTSYGAVEKFNGTSAATPHVAGASALVLSAYPAYGPAEVQAFLEGRAVDMGADGMDNLYGYGRLHLGDPPSAEPPPPEDSFVYLPMLVNNFPFIPAAPSLNAIDNADGDGNYTVTWTSSTGATSYTLQEDDNVTFSSPTTVYSGSGASTDISGRDVGVYYYRARASNAYFSSDWSNTRSVTVTVEPPACPQTGHWSGTTSQGRAISFDVANSPSCQIVAESLHLSVRDSCGFGTTTQFMNSFSITNNHFATGSGSTSTWVQGDFTASSSASGTFNFYIIHPYEPWPCTASGTWSATP